MSEQQLISSKWRDKNFSLPERDKDFYIFHQCNNFYSFIWNVFLTSIKSGINQDQVFENRWKIGVSGPFYMFVSNILDSMHCGPRPETKVNKHCCVVYIQGNYQIFLALRCTSIDLKFLLVVYLRFLVYIRVKFLTNYYGRGYKTLFFRENMSFISQMEHT